MILLDNRSSPQLEQEHLRSGLPATSHLKTGLRKLESVESSNTRYYLLVRIRGYVEPLVLQNYTNQ